MSWTADDLTFDLVAEMTEHPVVTAHIETPVGLMSVMAEPEERGRTLVLRGFNIGIRCRS